MEQKNKDHFINGSLILFIAVSLYAYAFWTNNGMRRASSFKIESNPTNNNLLIATQGSSYKDSLTILLVKYFKEKPVNIHVIDIKELKTITPSDWDAICLIHTWEMWSAPKVVRKFIKKNKSLAQLVVHTTSGDSEEKMLGVDAITGASVLTDLTVVAQQLIDRLDSLLFPHQSAAY